jgi:hypothetical protein
MFVRLKKNWPGQFRRSVKDATGETVSILEWSPSDPVPMEITDELELAAIRNDLGKALQEVAPPMARPVKTAELEKPDEPVAPAAPEAVAATAEVVAEADPQQSSEAAAATPAKGKKKNGAAAATETEEPSNPLQV